MLRTLGLCGRLGRKDQALTLPSTMGKLHNLTLLEIDEFHTTSDFPESIFTLPALASVTLYKVPLTDLPDISNMTALTIFALGFNNLTKKGVQALKDAAGSSVHIRF